MYSWELWSRQLIWMQVCCGRTFPKATFPPSLWFSPCPMRRRWLSEEIVFVLQLANPPSQGTNLSCVWLYQVKQHQFVLRNSLIWLEPMYWNCAHKSIDNCEFLYFGSAEVTGCSQAVFFRHAALLQPFRISPFPLGRKINRNLCLGRAQVFLLALSFLAAAPSPFPSVHLIKINNALCWEESRRKACPAKGGETCPGRGSGAASGMG